MKRLCRLASSYLLVMATLAWGEASSQPSFQVPEVAPTDAAHDGDPVNLSTGLYLRRSVDLVLMDRLPVVFSRTYRNADPRSRPFGIGTNHSFGSFLVGDAPAITYIDLILPDGGRVHFDRLDGGTGVTGASFEHTSSPSEYRGARLWWNGAGWTVRLQDSSVYTYPDCPPSLGKPCTVSSYRDAAGAEIRMTHDRRMNLVRIESDSNATIKLTYDGGDRIVLAESSDGVTVQYTYDALGRLVRVTNSDGATSTYGYDTRNQMIHVDDASAVVDNSFDRAGRCIVNVVRLKTSRGLDPPDRFTFTYTINNAGRITGVDVERPSGRRRVTFNERGYVLTDTVDGGGAPEFGAAFRREAGSNVVQRVLLWCGRDRRKRIEAAIDPDWPLQRFREEFERLCR